MPKIGDTLHYVSRGSADGKFPPACRAATVTLIDKWEDPGAPVSLAVLNPSGLFFDHDIKYDAMNNRVEVLVPGTWHWPSQHCEQIRKLMAKAPEPEAYRHMVIRETWAQKKKVLTSACGKVWEDKGPTMAIKQPEECPECLKVAALGWRA